ncbi:MAG: hypothetical protein J1F39_05705 [Clostridiales bacterium]|nr:hypothetical protein [Clostridiales bacterium]
MVTYCIGSARIKREYFADSGAIVLDNVEVLFCASENGRNYFAYGDVPFGSFTVEEYLTYRRALTTEPFSEKALLPFKIPATKRINKLCPAELRCVMFLEKTTGHTDKTLVVNLDGVKYTRRNNAALKRLIKSVNEVFVCVSDARFVANADRGYKTLLFGKPAEGIKPRFYAAKRLAKRIGARRASIM